MKNLKTINVTLRVRLISNFFQLIITTAFLPFTALYLNEMVNAKFSGIFLSILIILNIPINLLGGQIIDSFPKRKTVITYQVILVISLFFMAISLIENLNNIFLFCLTYAIFSVIWGLQFPAMSAIVMDAITPDVENIVYKIDCLDCDATYVGQTKRKLATRIKEHATNLKLEPPRHSVITKHRIEMRYNFDWENITIFNHKPNYYKRLVSEMIYIKEQKNGINLQTDTE